MLVTRLLSNLIDSTAKEDIDYDNLVPIIPAEKTIKKCIFQICLRGKREEADSVIASLPAPFLNNIAYLKESYSSYEYKLYSDVEAESFVLEHYGEDIFNYYQRFNNQYLVAKADFLRNLILYALGGIYLDFKSSITGNLNQYIYPDDQYLILNWDNIAGGKRHFLIPEEISGGELLMGIMVGRAGNNVSRSVIKQILYNIDHYNPYRDGVGWAGVMNTTGNAMYTMHVNNLIKEHPSWAREEKAFSNLGFVLDFSGEYAPGEYQKIVKIPDYREQYLPLLYSGDRLIDSLNKLYLSIIHFAQNSIQRK